MAHDPVTVELGWPHEPDPAAAITQRRVAWQPPELPGLPDDVPRRSLGGGWTPLDSIVIARHRSPNGHVKHTNSHSEPRGYRCERLLGHARRDPAPSTLRLSVREDDLRLDDGRTEAPADRIILGNVEQLPYVLLAPLELRRMHAGGQLVLADGVHDPIQHESDLVEVLGYVEPFPLEPIGPVEETAVWGMAALDRRLDVGARRHRYTAEPNEAPIPDGTARLGCVWTAPGPGRTPLQRGADGRLTTPVLQTRRGRPSPLAMARWASAPVRWAGARWAPRAVAARAAQLARPSATPAVEPAALGYLLRERIPGTSALLSAIHPVTGDQFVTRSEIEATDLGYIVEGVLGHVDDRGAQHGPIGGDIPWASRFGRGRRYREPD